MNTIKQFNMKNLVAFLLFVISLYIAGCSDDNEDSGLTDSSVAAFSVKTLAVDPSGGEVSAIIEWSATEWQIEVDVDNGMISSITPETGGNAQGEGYTRVRFSCRENKTGKVRTQDVFLVNQTDGTRSKLVLEQDFADASVVNGYFVSTTGSDEADGSKYTPFRTIRKAASVAAPGDTIFVEKGTYKENSIVPVVSGTAVAKIVFKPLNAAEPVIIQHPGSSVDDPSPVFDLTNKNYIHIEGFQFNGYKYGKASIYIDKGMGNVIFNNRFENLGTDEVGPWNATSVIFLYYSSKNIIRNNYFNNITGDGIGVNDSSGENLIGENTFRNFQGKRRSWATDGSTYASGITCQESKTGGNNIFAFNYATKGKNFLWFDRNGSDNIALRNVGYDSPGFIFNESRCVRNVLQENIAHKITGVAYEMARYETGETEDARWINNIAYNCKTGYYASKSWRNEFRNNITYNSTDLNIVFTTLAAEKGPHTFKNNLWYTSNKANSMQFKGSNISPAAFATQPEINETGGLDVDPLFVNPEQGDFALQSTSPAKGTSDTGADRGAYAVYGKTNAGYNEMQPSLGDMQVGFSSIVSSSKSGSTIDIEIELNRTSRESVNVEIVPVAGDAQLGKDFDISTQIVTFAAGERRKTVSVAFKGTIEYDQLIAFKLQNASNAQIGAINTHVVRMKKNE